ncbi:hypothetical protein GCM10009681_10810 [Luedemannella helvata]|uniref:Secreted protein n=1 Tax=Luedemannella helvata TaxID=349315 RepID=A0ABN2JWZ1_9ACTN
MRVLLEPVRHVLVPLLPGDRYVAARLRCHAAMVGIPRAAAPRLSVAASTPRADDRVLRTGDRHLRRRHRRHRAGTVVP